jgi:hypothetical protein
MDNVGSLRVQPNLLLLHANQQKRRLKEKLSSVVVNLQRNQLSGSEIMT